MAVVKLRLDDPADTVMSESPEVFDTVTVLLVAGCCVSFTWKVLLEPSFTFREVTSVVIWTSFAVKFARIVAAAEIVAVVLGALALPKLAVPLVSVQFAKR